MADINDIRRIIQSEMTSEQKSQALKDHFASFITNPDVPRTSDAMRTVADRRRQLANGIIRDRFTQLRNDGYNPKSAAKMAQHAVQPPYRPLEEY